MICELKLLWDRFQKVLRCSKLPRSDRVAFFDVFRLTLIAAILVGIVGIPAYAIECSTIQEGTVVEDGGVDRDVIRMAATIDRYITTALAGKGVSKPASASDSEFFRRASLDLTGINPDPSRVVQYVQSSEPDKRSRMLNEMVGSAGFAVRIADYWTELLIPDAADTRPPQERESLRRWLLDRFADNVRYDRIVADLLISTGDPNEHPTAFFTALELKPEKLAERTSRVFLGVALDCAQCHDHPFDTWKQSDFWGVAAYFARIQSPNRNNGNNMLGAGVFDVEAGEVQIPDTTTIVPPKPLLQNVESSLGIGSRRQQLAIWVTSKQNSWFAKAAVNRIWAMMMGRGIVEPVDDIGGKSIPAYPGLLEELATYFQSTKFDVRKLALAIAQSEAYSASSRDYQDTIDAVPFASMRPKPLTARQLAACLRQAARQPNATSTEDVWNLVARQLGTIRGESSEYAGGVLQSLLLQNSVETEQLWIETTSRLLKAVYAPHIGPEERLDWIFLATLSRYPTDAERTKIQTWTSKLPKDEESEKAWQADLIWALINSTEFGMTP